MKSTPTRGVKQLLKPDAYKQSELWGSGTRSQGPGVVLSLATILIFHKVGAVILEPGSWILTPATRRRLRIPSTERRPAGAARARGRSWRAGVGASSSAG